VSLCYLKEAHWKKIGVDRRRKCEKGVEVDRKKKKWQSGKEEEEHDCSDQKRSWKL
jgi:hypothetical protein